MAWLLVVLLLLVFDIYVILRNPQCQTWLSQKIASYMASELKTKISIRGVDVELFKKVVLEGIYVEDQHGDTLLYADKLKADIHRFSYDNHYLSLDGIELDKALIKLKKYKGEKGLSYRYITQYFKSSDTTKQTSKSLWKVEVGNVKLNNIVFAYIDTRDTIDDPGMDYENIRVTGVSTNITDIDPMGDSLSLHINNLRGVERCGFALKDFNTRLTVSDSAAHMDNLHFITKGSAVQGFISFYFNSTDDIADDFIHLVKMDGHFTNSVVEMGDIAYFSPNLLGIKKKVLLTGDIKGTVDHLKCKNIDLRFGERSHIAGNFSFNGLPDINETDMNFKFREAVTNRKDLEGIPIAPFDNKHFLKTDDNIAMLGDIRFAGSFEGFVNDFVATGKLQTAIGSLTMKNLAMVRDADSLPYTYSGEVFADAFNVGGFYGVPDLSVITGDVTIHGTGLSSSDINANIDGKISLLHYHDYNYTNITVSNGNVRRQVFSGDVNVDDPNVKIVFNGSVDNSGVVPKMKFDAHIDSANLGELHFLDKTHEYFLTTDLHMDFSGDNIDNLAGSMRVFNLNYVKDGEKFKFNDFSLYGGGDADKDRTIFLQSDIVIVTLKGKFKLMELPHSMSNLLSNYLPSYFPPENVAKSKSNAVQEFNWYFTFGQNTKPIEVLIPGLKIAPKTTFFGSFNSTTRAFSSNFTSPYVAFNDIYYNGIQINADNAQRDTCVLKASLTELKITDTIGTKNMRLEVRAFNDSLKSRLSWDNHTEKLNDANIETLVHFESQHSFQMNVLSTTMHLNDSLWTVSSSNFVRLDSNRFTFHDLIFQSGDQSIGLNGFISPQPNDELKITMNKFNIAYLNYFSKQVDITLAGTISGQTGLSDLYHAPIFNSETNFQDFFVNGQRLGDGALDAEWMKPKEAVYLHGHFSKGIVDNDTKMKIDNIIFEGFYYPKKKENSLDINASFAAMALDILAPLLKDYCSVLKGDFDGNLHITGTPNKPLLDGKMMVWIRRAMIDYLGLAISAPKQPIQITSNSFFFDNFKVADTYSDTAKIYGNLFHDNFQNFQFDMDFGFDHFLVLNTTADQNELYYGRVFASGYMNIFGYVNDKVRIDMNVKTDKIYSNGQPLYSQFNIPMSTTSEEAGSNDFITFLKPSSDTLGKGNAPSTQSSGVDLHMVVEATPDAEVKVIFDKTVGDEITAYGSGIIRMDVTSTGDFSIMGQYAVDHGSYLFTMKNLVYVPFELAKGGVLSWNGDPYEAQINADAVYKANASVEPFFPLDSSNQAYHKSYPVDVVMHLEKNLMNPEVTFDINLPTADQNIQETVKSYTSTDLEKNKQVLSLMVLNSFMTPSDLREGTGSNQNVGGAASATLLSNFVSGTLNNWLGQISSDYTMTVKYRPNDDLSTQELKVYMGTQLLNNRITVDVAGGKVNTNTITSTNANGQWVGDVNVEYKVTPDGKVRLRAFNRSNDNTVLNANSPYTQGVGLFYREDFETGAELLARYKKALKSDNPNRKKKSDDSVPQPSSTPAPVPKPQTPTPADSTHS